MKILSALAATVVCLLIVPAYGAAAQELTEDDVLTSALARSVTVKQIDAELAEKLGEAKALRTLSNPELEGRFSTAVRDKGEDSDDEYEIGIAQPLRASQFGSRSVVSDLISRAAGEDQKLAVLELNENVRLTFAEVWVQHELMRRLDASIARGQRYTEQLERGQARGVFPPGETRLFQADAMQRKARLLAIEGSKSESLAKLTRLTSFDLSGRALKRPADFPLPSRESLLKALSQSSLPVQLREGLRRKLTAERLQLAERDTLPEFTPRLAFEHTDDGDDRLSVGLSVGLPFFDRNQAERIKSEAADGAQAARHEYFDGAEFRSEVELLLKRAELKRREAILYEQEVVPALRAALGDFEKQLHAGQGVLLQLWQTQKELSDAEEQALIVWLEARRIESELRVSIGGDI